MTARSPDDLEQTIITLAAGDVLSQRYRLVREIGRGGMGVVWLAEDAALDRRRVAVKVLPFALTGSVRSVARLKREAMLAMDLAHPHIARVHNFELDTSRRHLGFLVMQYVRGTTLDDLLAGKPGGLEPERVLVWAGQIAGALDFAHAREILHRDLKPSNIMIDVASQAYLMDFGVAREAKDTITRVTGAESSGTLLYMSPQQIAGENGPSNDIYSFAATLYEALGGNPPFRTGDVVTQIRDKQPERLAGVPAAVNDTLLAGLAKRPEDRPKSAGELVARMREGLARPQKERARGKVPAGFEVLDAAAGSGGWARRIREPRTGAILRLVPSGEFVMGTERGPRNERPAHLVAIPEPFYLGCTPVTQAQWAAVMGSKSDHSRHKGATRPVDSVSWNEGLVFLTRLKGDEAGRWRFGYPGEAQWEYACRAGTRSAYWFGDDVDQVEEHAWVEDNAGGRTHPVGWPSHMNPWGLYDMHGNVWEWCADHYHESYAGAPRDDRPWLCPGSNLRVIRGGSVRHSAASCRAANRRRAFESKRYGTLGFRMALLPRGGRR